MSVILPLFFHDSLTSLEFWIDSTFSSMPCRCYSDLYYCWWDTDCQSTLWVFECKPFFFSMNALKIIFAFGSNFTGYLVSSSLLFISNFHLFLLDLTFAVNIFPITDFHFNTHIFILMNSSGFFCKFTSVPQS